MTHSTAALGATLAAGLITVVALNASSQTPAAAPAVDFVRDVRPILESRCYECHGPRKVKGRLRLDLKSSAIKGGLTGPAVIPGNADDSLLVRRVLGLDGEDRMPKDKDPLPDPQVALLRAWIAQGAAWPDDGPTTAAAAAAAAPEEDLPQHWAYRRPVRPTPPAVTHKAWVRNPIDQFVAARLEKEGLEPSPEASKEALIRRVSLDLVGLPPTPAEIDAFVADTAPDAYERLVDRLLASPHYGERWARPWLDLARYADSNGYEKDDLRTMWKYRDWVIKALNDDLPFDQFTIEQIAGDMLPNPTADQLIASGFHRNTQLNQEGGIDVEEARWETLLDRVNTTGTVWLGSHHRLRAVPQPQVRSVLAARLLPAARLLQQRRIHGPWPAGRRPLDCGAHARPAVARAGEEAERSRRRAEDAQREAHGSITGDRRRTARVGAVDGRACGAVDDADARCGARHDGDAYEEG